MKKEPKKYIRDYRSPIPTCEEVSWRMSKIKRKDTNPELLVRKGLQKKGLRGYRLHLRNIPGTPDICFIRKKVAIFVNGCFWHGCPYCQLKTPNSNKKFWEEKLKRNKERDLKKLSELKILGWRTIVIWECQINENLVKQIQLIESLLKEE